MRRVLERLSISHCARVAGGLLWALALASQASAQGIWISPAEVMALPASGPAWLEVEEKALRDWGEPSIDKHASRHDVLTYAGALYALRKGDAAVRQKVEEALDAATGTGLESSIVALSRNVMAYIVAADLIGYESIAFDDWLQDVRSTTTTNNLTIIEAHERRPNNVGAESGAVRIAIALWFGDTAELGRAADVFHGFVGNRQVYSDFAFGELDWQADPALPVGINPLGAERDGRVFDGILPDDLRRCECSFDPTGPFPQENYTWEALQGLVAQAEMLTRAGYPAYAWQDEAIRRAVAWQQEQAFYPAEEDDTWVPYVVNAAYGEDYCTRHPGDVRTGKLIGFTDWTHPGAALSSSALDTDGDCIPDDGDASGIAGDHYCSDYEVTGCDDNCPYHLNYDQVDRDADGLPDACNACSEIRSVYPQSPSGAYELLPLSLVWTATDGDAPVGRCSIDAQPGDAVTLNVLVNPGLGDARFAGVSLAYDTTRLRFERLAQCPGPGNTPAGGNALDGVCSESSASPGTLTPLAPAIPFPSQGVVASLNAATSGAPVSVPFDLGAVEFTVLDTPAVVSVVYLEGLDSVNDGAGNVRQPAAPPATVPEPTTVLGIAAGALLIHALARRRRPFRAKCRLVAPLVIALVGWLPVASDAADLDADTIPDELDNCVLVPNAPPMDCDHDQDGYGNRCDGDLDQSGSVDQADYTLWEASFQSSFNAADLNCDGIVGGPDHALLYPLLVEGGAPGPSGLPCAGTVPCTPLPEPGVTAGLGACLAALAVLRGARRREPVAARRPPPGNALGCP